MGASLPITFRIDSSRFGIIPKLRTSPPASATATAIVSAWTSNPTKRTLDMSDLSFRMRLCAAGFTSSQRNPRYCETVGRSILTNGILESSLYVSDLARSIQFYETIFGFRVISDFGGRGCALEAGSRQVLLLFKKGASRAITAPHDGDGELHLAFAIGADELPGWEAWLAENDIQMEEKTKWERG